MIEDTGATGRILKEFNVTRERLMRALQEAEVGSFLRSGMAPAPFGPRRCVADGGSS